jgi:hypothetical protein
MEMAGSFSPDKEKWESRVGKRESEPRFYRISIFLCFLLFILTGDNGGNGKRGISVIRPSLIVVCLRNERQRSGNCNRNLRIFLR